jgi:hypothetical protein
MQYFFLDVIVIDETGYEHHFKAVQSPGIPQVGHYFTLPSSFKDYLQEQYNEQHKKWDKTGTSVPPSIPLGESLTFRVVCVDWICTESPPLTHYMYPPRCNVKIVLSTIEQYNDRIEAGYV